MTRRCTAELNDQCLDVRYDTELSGGVVTLECFGWLRDAGYPVEAMTDVQTAVSIKDDADDDGYLVACIETLAKPTEEADVVEDTFKFWACSCPGFHYHAFPDLDAASITTVGECSHVEKVKRKHRLAIDADDGQETLV